MADIRVVMQRSVQLLFFGNTSEIGDSEKLALSRKSVMLALNCRCIAAEHVLAWKSVLNEKRGLIVTRTQKWEPWSLGN